MMPLREFKLNSILHNKKDKTELEELASNACDIVNSLYYYNRQYRPWKIYNLESQDSKISKILQIFKKGLCVTSKDFFTFEDFKNDKNPSSEKFLILDAIIHFFNNQKTLVLLDLKLVESLFLEIKKQFCIKVLLNNGIEHEIYKINNLERILQEHVFERITCYNVTITRGDIKNKLPWAMCNEIGRLISDRLLKDLDLKLIEFAKEYYNDIKREYARNCLKTENRNYFNKVAELEKAPL